jgi:hypothetical protein
MFSYFSAPTKREFNNSLTQKHFKQVRAILDVRVGKDMAREIVSFIPGTQSWIPSLLSHEVKRKSAEEDTHWIDVDSGYKATYTPLAPPLPIQLFDFIEVIMRMNSYMTTEPYFMRMNSYTTTEPCFIRVLTSNGLNDTITLAYTDNGNWIRAYYREESESLVKEKTTIDQHMEQTRVTTREIGWDLPTINEWEKRMNDLERLMQLCEYTAKLRIRYNEMKEVFEVARKQMLRQCTESRKRKTIE